VAEAAERLDLLPPDHVRLLHPIGRRGIATVAYGGERWREVAVSIAELPAYVADKGGTTDLFLSQQSFFGWRRIAQLAQLGAAYVDLDYHRTDRWAAVSPEGVAGAVLELLDDSAIAAPSYILSTGRGLLVVWLHGLVPRRALPRWMAVQKHLAAVLAGFGADQRALDAARVFRLAGTENSRSHTIVRPVYLAAPAAQLWRWDFDDLAKEILPLDRAEIIALRAHRAARKAQGNGPTPTAHLTAATYWETVLADLQRLRHARWFGPLPPGQRDEWLFLAACAMSWLAPPMALRRELYALAQECGGWTEAEARSRMSAVFRRAEQAATGQRIEYRGRLFDPRYRFKAATIIERLEITPAEMHAAGLRVLVDQDRHRELATERKEASRRRAGVVEREAYVATAQARRERVHALRSEGRTWRAIGAELGISEAEARRLWGNAQGRSRCMVVKPDPKGTPAVSTDTSPPTAAVIELAAYASARPRAVATLAA
jgi:hypothetical protein